MDSIPKLRDGRFWKRPEVRPVITLLLLSDRGRSIQSVLQSEWNFCSGVIWNIQPWGTWKTQACQVTGVLPGGPTLLHRHQDVALGSHHFHQRSRCGTRGFPVLQVLTSANSTTRDSPLPSSKCWSCPSCQGQVSCASAILPVNMALPRTGAGEHSDPERHHPKARRVWGGSSQSKSELCCSSGG